MFEQCLFLPILPQIKGITPSNDKCSVSISSRNSMGENEIWNKYECHKHCNLERGILMRQIHVVHCSCYNTITNDIYSRISLPPVINKPFNVHCSIKERSTDYFMDWKAFCTDGKAVGQVLFMLINILPYSPSSEYYTQLLRDRLL